MPSDKLYVKIICPMCSGTKLHEHSGYHSPRQPYKWKCCPYCDYDGQQLIEASQNAVVEYFIEIGDKRRQEILQKIAMKIFED
jgi:hypothetical protein